MAPTKLVVGNSARPPPSVALGAAVPRLPKPCANTWRSGADVAKGAVQRRIVDHSTLQRWQKSESHADVMRFIGELCAAVPGTKLSDALPLSAFARAVCNILETANTWIDQIPPLKQSMRYGNPAFRDWHKKLCDNAPGMMRDLLSQAVLSGDRTVADAPSTLPRSFIESALCTRVEYEASLQLTERERRELEEAAERSKTGGLCATSSLHWGALDLGCSPPSREGTPSSSSTEDSRAYELAAYFAESFGNATRVDYGTGHELAFLVWLRCLERMGYLAAHERAATALVLFQRYLLLMRRLQTTYWLEPAGSCGVWGLDDYQFLPFLIGAAQLAKQTTQELPPSAIHDQEVLTTVGDDYLYFAAIRFIKRVKRGHFGEHSPMLNDISHLETWERVASGLMRMYAGEVIGKLQVVQHLPFGTLLPWAD